MIKSKKTLKGRISVLIGLLTAFFLPVASAAAGATSSNVPLHFLRSADCTGEVVEISGTVHFVNQTQADGSIVGHFNYQNVTGLGLTSGNTYQTAAVDHIRLSAPFPSDITSVQNFLLISRGSDSNLTVQVIYHITINADGTLTVHIDDLNMQCT